MNFVHLVLALSCLLNMAVPALCDGGRRVFYVNSYHEGYGSSDDVTAAIKRTLTAANVELEIFYMDTKRRSSEAQIRARVAESLNAIKRFKPEVIIASDDNAVKYLITPHYKNGPVPVVFCGVNWSAAHYGLPTMNVTGMIEVVPIAETLRTIRHYYPHAKTLFVLSEDSVSELSNRRALNPLYKQHGLTSRYSMVEDYTQWKRQFLLANKNADIIYLPTNGAIKNWDDQDAREFIKKHIAKPVITTDDFMMPYAVFGRTKVASEQGEWAARSALEILAGKNPSQIPVTKNHLTKAHINSSLAEAVGFKPEAALLKEIAK